jgi:hypothetical protein
MEVVDQRHAPVALAALGDWMGPRAGLDAVAKRKNSIIAPAGI